MELFKLEYDRGDGPRWEMTLPGIGSWLAPLLRDEAEAELRYVKDYPYSYPNPRIVPLTAWQDRMAHRLRTGEHEPLPWTVAEWWSTDIARTHFPHVAKSDPAKVAFVEDDAKGKADRITVMKPGRFLAKFYGDVLTPEQIGEIANKYVARTQPGKLRFAHTADEMEWVYLEGPSSCMSQADEEYESPYHPVRVYAAGDLAVAYIDRGGITARALCWPERKLYSRVYGDADRLKPALEAEGYTQGALSGARLVRDEYEPDRFVCPYIDAGGSREYGASNVTDRGDFLVVDPDGEMSACETGGYVEGEAPCCECCGERSRDEMTYVEGHGDWCDDCLSEHATYCEREMEYRHNDDVTYLEASEESVSDWYFERHHGYTCDATSNAYLPEDEPPVAMDDGSTWCQSYFDEHGFRCEVSSANLPLERGVEHPDFGMIDRESPEGRALLADMEAQLSLAFDVA